MIGQSSLTATVAFTYATSYTPEGQRQVDAFPAGGFTIDPTTLELQPLPVLKRKNDTHTTSNERRQARDAWRTREADQLCKAVSALIALSPRIAERMRELQTSNQPAPEGISRE